MSKHRIFRSRNAKVSFMLERRTLWVCLILFVLCIAAMIISTGTGSQFVSPLHVIKALFGDAPPMEQVIVMRLRSPRIIIAVLIGAALAVAGLFCRASSAIPWPPRCHRHNGGSFAWSGLFIFMFTGTVSIHWMPLFAILGAFFITGLLYVLA